MFRKLFRPRAAIAREEISTSGARRDSSLRNIYFSFTSRSVRCTAYSLISQVQIIEMPTWSLARWTFTIMGFVGVLAILQVLLMRAIGELQGNAYKTEILNSPVILWWTSSFGYGEQYRNCGNKRCYFTNKRSNVLNPRLEAIMFYGSGTELKDLPIPRPANVKWALLHEESPRNNPIFVYEDAVELFNYSATFSRYSDLPLTLLFLPGEKELLGTNYFLRVEEKNRLIATKELAPVLYIQTDCDTVNNRDSYVAELMKHIRVDSYGACLNNRRLPESLRENYIEKLDSEEFLRFVGAYKFTLAFENAVCDDYITEKLWRPLVVGSIPIYYGSPSFEDWLPNEKSAIAVEDFDGPKDLADFLNEINNNDELYDAYLTHKLSANYRLSNPRILDEFETRSTYEEDTFFHHVRAFECLVCEGTHDDSSLSSRKIRRMTRKQYNCSLPKDMIANEKGTPNSWLFQWTLDKCAAKLLARHVSTGKKINIDEFHDRAFKMYRDNDCE